MSAETREAHLEAIIADLRAELMASQADLAHTNNALQAMTTDWNEAQEALNSAELRIALLWNHLHKVCTTHGTIEHTSAIEVATRAMGEWGPSS